MMHNVAKQQLKSNRVSEACTLKIELAACKLKDYFQGLNNLKSFKRTMKEHGPPTTWSSLYLMLQCEANYCDKSKYLCVIKCQIH